MKVRFFILAILMIAGLLTSLFSTNRLTRFCLYTPIKVLLLSLATAVMLWFVSDSVFDDVNAMDYMDVDNKELFFYPFFVCFSCVISSYTIFLSKIRLVRTSFVLSFICFLLLPLFLALLAVLPQVEVQGYYIQTAYYSLAFIFPQAYFFIDFWQKSKKGIWD